MKILLIGYQGYVGAGLYNYLTKEHEVMGWGKSDNILKITTEYLLQNNIDVIVNAATIMDRVNPTFAIDSLTYQINIHGMNNLVMQLKETRIKLIHISTKDVYGNIFNKNNVVETEKYYKLPFFVSDNYSFNPSTAYGKSKLVSEYIAECHANYIIIRLSSCYTDFDHYRGHWVPNVIKSLFCNSNIKLTNQGKQVRDLLHVIDLGKLINIILKFDKKGLKINAGGGKKNIWSLLQFVELMDSKSNISFTPGGDYGFVFSNDLVTKELKWEPKIIFHERLPIIKKNLVEGISAISPTNVK